MLINTGNISRKVLSKVLRSFDKNFERLHFKSGFSSSFINTGMLKFIDGKGIRQGGSGVRCSVLHIPCAFLLNSPAAIYCAVG